MNNKTITVQHLYQKGLSLWQQKEANQAFQYFQNVLTQTDDKPSYLLLITQLLLDSGHHHQGIEVLNQFHLETLQSSTLQVRLALLHSKAKAPTTAISVLKECIKKEPACVDAYTLLAEIYGNSKNIALATEVLSSLMNQYPEDVSIHNSAASYLTAIGAEAAALKAYRLCINEGQQDASTLSKIAKLHHSLGDFDEATRYNFLAITKDPNSAAAYLGIATSKKFGPDDELIVKRLNESFNLNLNPEVVTMLHFCLGKINDDLQNFELAFEHFRKANQQKQLNHSFTFNINTIKKQFASVKNYFTKQQIALLQKKINNKYKPIFIVGMPRSGTTLLERIFLSNRNVFCAGELETLDLFPRHIENSTQNKFPYPEILSYIPESALEYYSDQYLKSTTVNFSDYHHVLDKNPLNFINIGLIKILFPQAKIIHCTRNPLDTCLSLYFQNFAHEKLNFSYSLDGSAEYYSEYLDLMQHWDDQELDILTIGYEDIIKDTTSIIDQLRKYTELEQLKLPSRQQMTKSIHTASVWQARQNIYKGSVNRWKNYQEPLAKFISRYPDIFSTVR